ncbi:hypothetical protein [Caulobacter sp.]|uniref:hypothetical protein n=1 Tax=Caulobacter sp. TaxID=78 RepID=UPI001B0FEBE7|nr:hypothetical protein [Caulobacter sp.]MBO9546680.1 hypothetical protein [Caulobacter sp.]
MSKFSASDAAFSGFRLVRENLKSIGWWVLIMTVVSIIYSVLMIMFFGKELNAFTTYMQTVGGDPDPNELSKVLGDMTPAWLVSIPYMLLVNGVMFAGVNRLVQRPHDKGFAHLRLGVDEVRQAIVWLLFNLVLFGVLVISSILMRFLGALGGATGAFLVLVIFLGMIGAMIYLAVSLSLCTAATFDTGKVTLFKTLPMTRGQFWPMIGAYFLAAVMFVIVLLLLLSIVSGVAAIISGDIGVSARLMRSDTTSLQAYFTPLGIAQALLSGAITVLTSLIIFTPVPSMYLALKGGEPAATDGDGGW